MLNKFNVVQILLMIIGIIALIVGCILPLTWLARNLFYEQIHKDDWRVTTTPLDMEVVNDICAKFYIQKEDSICRGNKQIYAPDIFPIIADFIESNNSTYEEIHLLIGNYQSELETKVILGSGNEYFRSWYDLNGDGKTALVIFFDGDGNFLRIHFYFEDAIDN